MLASWRLLTGECLDVLATLEPESVDACVTDPPYGIGFMGREWDVFAPESVAKVADQKRGFDRREPNPNLRGRSEWLAGAKVQYDRSAAASLKFQAWTKEWAEAVLRVLKPGAHAVVCASPRMGHRVTCGLEDAGFEIRDSLLWLYGSGFPKSLNLPGGLGTALKPAYEPVILARKPLGGRTVAQCVAEFGTGALNIDGCRLETSEHLGGGAYGSDAQKRISGFWQTADRSDGQGSGFRNGIGSFTQPLGRWPPNVALDEEAAAIVDAEAGDREGGWPDSYSKRTNMFGLASGRKSFTSERSKDFGGTSRFFYVAKASRDERERGCENLPQRTAGDATDRQDGSAGLNSPRAGASRTHGARNHHPTVKPVALMRWLVRLVTPPGGLVLDPFAGSGTTGLACIKEQRRFLGIEREAEYVAIANARLRAEHARFDTGGPLFAETAEPADGSTMATTYQL